jgi:hypothetical protein
VFEYRRSRRAAATLCRPAMANRRSPSRGQPISRGLWRTRRPVRRGSSGTQRQARPRGRCVIVPHPWRSCGLVQVCVTCESMCLVIRKARFAIALHKRLGCHGNQRTRFVPAGGSEGEHGRSDQPVHQPAAQLEHRGLIDRGRSNNVARRGPMPAIVAHRLLKVPQLERLAVKWHCENPARTLGINDCVLYGSSRQQYSRSGRYNKHSTSVSDARPLYCVRITARQRTSIHCRQR